MVGPKLVNYGRGLQNPLLILEPIESVTGKHGKPWPPVYQVLVIAMGSPTLPKTSTSGSRRCRPEARMMAGYTNNTDLTALTPLFGRWDFSPVIEATHLGISWRHKSNLTWYLGVLGLGFNQSIWGHHSLSLSYLTSNKLGSILIGLLGDDDNTLYISIKNVDVHQILPSTFLFDSFIIPSP